ncbi:MAG: hypothetical protein LBC02_09205 [Planctomycetaceae bacterium]|nr:hypothetical protein [Planctomycetaceae bacterium]
MLSKSVNNVAFNTADELGKPSNMIVLLTSKLGNISRQRTRFASKKD